MVGGVRFEHTHRLIAATVGFLTIILAVWLWMEEPRRWVKKLGAFAALAVILQGLLGGITVLYGLPQIVSVSHAVLAQTFLCICVCIAVVTHPRWTQSTQPALAATAQPTAPKTIVAQDKTFFKVGCALTLLIYSQLILGAILRHGGRRIFLNLHIGNAALVTICVIGFYLWGRKWFAGSPQMQKWLAFSFLALCSQVLLGFLVYLPLVGRALFLLGGDARTFFVTVHVAFGALLLATVFSTTLWSYPRTKHE